MRIGEFLSQSDAIVDVGAHGRHQPEDRFEAETPTRSNHNLSTDLHDATGRNMEIVCRIICGPRQ